MTLPKFAIALLLLTFMVLVGAPRAQAAISCGTVDNDLIPCLGYLQTGGPVPDTCCQGIQSLYNAARTTEDRQSACKCLKSAAGMVSGINLDLAANLPSQCGVNIPYNISPNTNCNDVK